VGSVSVIGQVVELGQVVTVRNTAASDVHRLNEFLPDTQAELAIPLRLGDTILGALDVQSTQRDSFDEDHIGTLESLAAQITIALANAQLYDQTQTLLTNLQAQQQQRTTAAWREHIRLQRQGALITQAGRTVMDFTDLRAAANRTRQTVIGERTPYDTVPFAVPVIVAGQVLGVVEYEVPQATFSEDLILLAQEMAERLSISLENARLFQESQRATDRERIVNDIAARLTSQTDIQTILETAVDEVRRALRVPHVSLRLNLHEDDPIPANGHANGHANGNGNGSGPTHSDPA